MPVFSPNCHQPQKRHPAEPCDHLITRKHEGDDLFKKPGSGTDCILKEREGEKKNKRYNFLIIIIEFMTEFLIW